MVPYMLFLKNSTHFDNFNWYLWLTFLILHIDNVVKSIFQFKETSSHVTILFFTAKVCKSMLLFFAFVQSIIMVLC